MCNAEGRFGLTKSAEYLSGSGAGRAADPAAVRAELKVAGY